MLAPAKINLDLLITGRRDDGYHLLDSIVVFADYGDDLTAEISDQLSLTISGPFANGLSIHDNLILKAATLICSECGVEPNIKFHLVKNLPVSSGIGGGSADAAAALKLCIEKLSLTIGKNNLDKIALELGADIPVCLRSKACHMQGIGEDLIKINFNKTLHLLMVTPQVSVSTPEIFTEFKNSNKNFENKRQLTGSEIHLPFMLELLKESQNSLVDAACKIEPIINDVLDALSNTDEVLLYRMSGSGATCFALYEKFVECENARLKIEDEYTHWWAVNTKIK